jgi:hypothetical protein
MAADTHTIVIHGRHIALGSRGGLHPSQVERSGSAQTMWSARRLVMVPSLDEHRTPLQDRH